MNARAISLGVALTFSVGVFMAARRYRPEDTPHRPSSDGEVLEKLAAGTGRDPLADETCTLEAALARSPNDLSLALQVVRQHVTAARRSGDARRLSYAEAALAPWWSQPKPPVPALIGRAMIRQSRHEFTPALVDLDLALSTVPDDPQALVTRASVLTVLARYDEAERDCGHVTESLLAKTCATAAAAARGGGEARDRLSAAMGAPTVEATELRWAEATRGEAYLYAGENAAAERDLRAAMADGESYPRALLADLLLDGDRPREVLDLIASDETNEVLILRRAIAAKRLGAPDADALRETLTRFHADVVARGDTSHLREEARRLLALEGDAAQALPVAVASFAQQKEPWDARLLLEAAAGVDSVEARAAAATAVAWLERSRCAWPPLLQLVARRQKR